MQSQNVANNNSPTKIYLDVYFHGVRRLFVPVFDNTDHGDKKVEKNSHRKYFLPRVNITNYNVLIDAESFMINPFKINVKNMMKLENLQQDKEMISQQYVCYIINISKILTN